MPKATEGKTLSLLKDCYIEIPGFKVEFNIIPKLSDSKSASYNSEQLPGRANPLDVYSSSDSRTIETTIKLVVLEDSDIDRNLSIIRALQSCVYPREGDNNSPYVPPPVCKLKFGRLFGEDSLCVVLMNYNLDIPEDVSYDPDTFFPYRCEISCSWKVVYTNSDLPGQDRILSSGR